MTNKELIDQIHQSIQKKIEAHESKLEIFENDLFLKGCIAGLQNAMLSIPLVETLETEKL